VKRLKVTAAMLRRMGACARQVLHFDHVYPDGVVLTDEQEHNLWVVIDAREHLFNLWWFGVSLNRLVAVDRRLPGCWCWLCCKDTRSAEFAFAGVLANLVAALDKAP